MNTQAKIPPMELVHIDTCLPDYWNGHPNPYIQVPVYKGMSIKEFKEACLYEINDGCIAGSDIEDYCQDYELTESAYARFKAAVNKLRPAVKGTRTLFKDLEPETDDCCDSVYAFLVFVEE